MKTFTFNISLSILNHLGRNLYRSFITVLGEAISNSWDADAKTVRITIEKEDNKFIIEDDGTGMTEDDFQNKFLKIGYSKRKDNVLRTASGRPFIGRKGIGKLALLSCAGKITVLTKTPDSDFVGGVIDNSGLDQAIRDDVSANDYNLTEPPRELIENYKIKGFTKGTIIIFDDVNDGIKNKIEYIRKLVALHFRFSLLDPSFNIFMNNTEIGLNELQELTENTQFLWKINNPHDPYLDGLEKQESLKKKKDIHSASGIEGFIASVERPSMLKIRGADEKVSVDLFVNGRLREKNIINHIPTARIVENYLYGQIHYNELDDENDRFTSNREGIVSDDPKFQNLLQELTGHIKGIIDDWDIWRTDLRQDGDAENNRISLKTRKSQELFNVVSTSFIPQKSKDKNKETVEKWVSELQEDASFNFTSYAECFISENLLRDFILENKISFESKRPTIKKYRETQEKSKNAANISFDIRQDDSDLSYLAMDDLTELAETLNRGATNVANLHRDAKEYKPLRDAMAHMARLSSQAKNRLNTTYENIKARIVNLLSNYNNTPTT